jgi:hypothetical protein
VHVENCHLKNFLGVLLAGAVNVLLAVKKQTMNPIEFKNEFGGSQKGQKDDEVNF